ncbi:hypothetical protein [Chachezhania antarctica]|uniref:hypothetical protein n=1 Tax=Chachezhania antarctica TaxID=2340860 RepID=UPI000EB5A5C7|nr:hypothetical protein [Chachezhania antarctica]|tara:strand:+ start:3504 stop:4130 length:627 start_codon:yes stop_codon:yes gene_type:complete
MTDEKSPRISPRAVMGHNGGPTLEKGHSYRTFMWRQAQKQLLPNAVPLMVVRMRVKRAAELGMDYKTYASFRQYSGQDILGLLFSSNALGILDPLRRGPAMPTKEREALERIENAAKLVLVHAPLTPGVVAEANPVIDAAGTAPTLRESWSDTRVRLENFARAHHVSGNRLVIVGDAPLEQDWTAALRAAGYLPADRYFPHRAGTSAI